MKHIKQLTLTSIAALALTAVVGVASASAFSTFRAESAPVKLTGTQNQTLTFSTDAGTLSCGGGSLSGELTSTTSSSFEATPSFGGCSYLGVNGLSINTNGCKYRFYASGSADIVCSEGAAIWYSVAGCTVTVPAQTGIQWIGLGNSGAGSGRSVNLSYSVGNLKYMTSGFCTTSGVGSFSNGVLYGGATNVVAKTLKGAPVGFWVA
ncbi:MAG TPA: hypothetical protein VN732_04120 [Solirubrobacterales bacterium]|nr:hypothetical protein [Solirubrobacterales bacterium]